MNGCQKASSDYTSNYNSADLDFNLSIFARWTWRTIMLTSFFTRQENWATYFQSLFEPIIKPNLDELKMQIQFSDVQSLTGAMRALEANSSQWCTFKIVVVLKQYFPPPDLVLLAATLRASQSACSGVRCVANCRVRRLFLFLLTRSQSLSLSVSHRLFWFRVSSGRVFRV